MTRPGSAMGAPEAAQPTLSLSTSASGAVGDDVQVMAERAEELAAGPDDEQVVALGDGGTVSLRVEGG